MLQWVDTAIAFSLIMLLLSILITAAVQVVSAILDLRGKNLAMHLEALLEQIDPSFRDQVGPAATPSNDRTAQNHSPTIAHLIAQAVVCHPTVTHGFPDTGSWFTNLFTRETRAKAITADELLQVLCDLASEHPAEWLDTTAQAALREAMTRLDETSTAASAAVRITQEIATADPDMAQRFKEAVKTATTSASQVEAGITHWFNTVMDRSSDVFLRYTRTITMTCAVLLAFSLQIDAGRIFQQLARTPDVRAKVLAMQDSALAQADRTVDTTYRASKALQAIHDKDVQTAQIAKDSTAKAALESTASVLTAAPKNLVRCLDGAAWLNASGQLTAAQLQSLQTEFKAECQQQTEVALGATGQQIRDVAGQLDQSGVQLITTGVSFTDAHHFAGMIATIVLLSFGAPFWFNTLQQLVNLKPAIAQKLSSPSDENPLQPVTTRQLQAVERQAA
jgi:hypothetical protein